MPKSTPINELSDIQKSELATSLAALVLVDGEKEISEENLNAAIKAASCTVEAYYPTMFASLLSKTDVDVKDMIKLGGGGGGGGGAGGAGGAAAEEAVVEEEEEEEEEVEVGNMFGGDDDDAW